MAVTELEARLTRLEAEVEALKRKSAESDAAPKPWWEQISGVFKDCPEFEEVARLGREWRQSQGMANEEPDALANNAILLTRNLSDFNKVPGLRVEDWSV